MLNILPFTVFPLIIFNLFVFGLMGVDAGTADIWTTQVTSFNMLSGATWVINWSHLIILIGLIFLLVEMIKASRTGIGTVTDHLFSVIVFVVYLIEFLLVSHAAHSVFFILMTMAAIDVLAGFVISLRAARRDIGVAAPLG